MLQVKSLTAGYPDKPEVIRNLSFSLPRKGAFALMGPSGLGKTTLLRVLAGLLIPTSGDVAGLSAVKTTIMFQENRLLPWCSALKNVLLGMPAADETKARAMLTSMHIVDPEVLPNALSGGMQRRIALVRALLTGADVLLLDEPFTGMDQALKEDLAPIILQLDNLVVFSTHDASDAALMQAKVMMLHHDGVTMQ